MPICPNCGSRQPEQAAYCDECGASLVEGAPLCPRCGAHLEPGSKFCDMCGTPLAHIPMSGLSFEAAIPGRLVLQSTHTALPFPPGKAEVIIGRSDPAGGFLPDIDLTGYGAEEGGVSRRHARIFVQGSQVLIEDLNSTNATSVNRQQLAPRKPHPLQNGDELQLGGVRLSFHHEHIV